MNATAAYTRNQENFTAFHALQAEVAQRLASHPGVIRRWLDAQPERQARKGGDSGKPPRAWRTARLSIARRSELRGLIGGAEASPTGAGPLAAFLLAAMPVCTYLEIAGSALPPLQETDPLADDSCRRLSLLRERLFSGNFGLAQSAARQAGGPDASDLLSAASSGLLDAIDRYVPGERAARFGYFASYWIRYHLSRQRQKFGSLVSFPINQHRIGHRIDRYLADCEASGRPAPTEAELCAHLKLGQDAFYWHRLRPRVHSLEALAVQDPAAESADNTLCDPAPGPAAALEEAEIAGQIAALLRSNVEPATRVMLATMRNVGSLGEAARDYLDQVHDRVMDRIRPLDLPQFSDSRAFGTACDPAFRARKGRGGP
jgi:DNA-directed RNA polymerase specialized sigma subunit